MVGCGHAHTPCRTQPVSIEAPLGQKLGFACLLLLAFAAPPVVCPASAQIGSGPPRRVLINQRIDEGNLVRLKGNTRTEANASYDRGPVSDDHPMEHMLLQLQPAPEQEKALAEFLAQLHTPGSPNFHHWLTAQEFGARFGLAQQDLDTITGWLSSHGFTVNVVYPSGMVIDFSGTATQVRAAFHTEIHRLDVNGEDHIANIRDPRIPAALAPAVVGVVSLHDFRPRTMHRMRRPRANFTFDNGIGASYALVPADLATIYNLNPLFSAGYTGQGQTISLIEDTDVFSTSDWSTFRSTFGLSGYTSGSFETIHPAPSGGPNNCSLPTVLAPNDAEAILDAEWASAAAPNADIQMASCADTTTTFGGLIAIQNLLNAGGPPPAVMSISYGQCEAQNGAAANAAYNAAYQQADSEGVSIFVAAGDSGAAGCDNSVAAATQGIAVNAFASTPYNVAVGGTDFSDTYANANSTYWNSSNTSVFGSALSYIPEIPWNDSCAGELLSSYLGYSPTYGSTSLCNDPLYGSFFSTTVAGGGGPSGCATGIPSVNGVVSGTCQGWPKPTWQSVLGNPNDGVRDTPDISLFSGDGLWGHYYVFCWSDTAKGGAACSGDPSGWSGAGGTSFAAPIMAGIQALVNQKTGERQGNPNPVYYSLAANEYGSVGSSFCKSSLGAAVSAVCVFYDVTQGDMDVNCTGASNCYLPSGTQGVLSTSNTSFNSAYSATTGWDFATGIGTINAANLVNSWPTSAPDFTLSVSPSNVSITQGSSSASILITVNPLNGFSGNVSLSASALPSGVTASFNPVVTTATSTLTLAANSTATVGTVTIALSGSSGSVSRTVPLGVTVLAQKWSISGTVNNGAGATLILGGTANATMTADASGSFTFSGLINGSYSVAASKAGYLVAPASQNVTVNGGNVTGVNFTAGVVASRANWSVLYVDSQETSCGNYPAVLSFDGNPATMWHTQWCPSSIGPPHEIQINLGISYNLLGFQYLPRQDNSDNGKIKRYEFYVSTDGLNWVLVSSGALMTVPGDKSQKTVTFGAIQGQYVRLREISEINGNPWASMAEFSVLASSLPPDFSMSASTTTVTVAEGASGGATVTTTPISGFANGVTLSASGQPAGVSVTFSPSSIAFPGSGTSSVSFGVGSWVAVGSYPITISATGGGLTHNTTVTLNVAPVVLSQSGWTLKYVDSQEIACGSYGAVLSFDGNPTTLWHTAWCPTSPGPPHEIQINLGSSYTLAGFQYLPRQDSSDNGKIKQYEFYVSSDGTNWTLVASGVLMTTSGDKSQKTVTFNPIQGQYLRLREINEIHGNPWASMAELNLLYQ